MNSFDVSIEVHREGINGPLRIVHIEVLEVPPGASFLSITDVSNGFANVDDVTDFAYRMSFGIPSDFTGNEPPFIAVVAYGVVLQELIDAIRSAPKSALSELVL